MIATIATALFVVGGLTFIFTVLIKEQARNVEHPHVRILREAEDIIMQAARRIRREDGKLAKTPIADIAE